MLLGREREQQKVRQVLATARTGRSSVVVLVGEPGIGKSALLDDTEAAAAGMRALRARGVQSEGEVPFGGLLELLRPALAAVARIPAPQAGALESALALRPTGAYDRFAVGAATLSLLAVLAEERRSSSWSTTHSGSTRRAPKRSSSRSDASSPIRSPSFSPCARARPPSSTAPA